MAVVGALMASTYLVLPALTAMNPARHVQDWDLQHASPVMFLTGSIYQGLLAGLATLLVRPATVMA